MSGFSWVNIYQEIAKKIAEDNNIIIKGLLEECENCQVDYLRSKTNNDQLIELDLFTFFGSFNRDVKFENRKMVLEHLKNKLDLKENIPTDFDGIPTMNNQNSWFYWADDSSKDRSEELENLNTLFQQAVDYNNPIKESFNKCLKIDGIGIRKLTTGLFWINPDEFMPMAGPVGAYLKRKFPDFEYENLKGVKAWNNIFNKMDWDKYEIVLKYLSDQENNKKPFKELSLESIENSVENEIMENKNVIFHGAPGTGKTYSVLKAIETLTGGDSSRYTLVQFHPSYGYEDFIDGIKPIKSSSNGNINLVLENGTFKELCIKAFINLQSEDNTVPYFFIADEINRAELSRVFGELLLCLEDDKRLRFGENRKLLGAKIKTQNANLWEAHHAVVILDENDKIVEVDENMNYKLENNTSYKYYFGIPENIYFIGTMNDIDRSVDSFDMALRRRFTWIRTDFNERAIREKFATNKKLKNYISACNSLNEYITTAKDGFNLGLDYQLGQSYFLKPNDLTQDELAIVWDKYIAPILTEYLRSIVEQHEIPNKLKQAQKKFKL